MHLGVCMYHIFGKIKKEELWKLELLRLLVTFLKVSSCKQRRLEDAGKFQAPQSLPGSYFVQQPSGRWALQVPEEPVVRESFRWPIGFITTGFIRGR